MGYTHYWYVRKDTPPEQLVEAGRKMIQVVEAADVPLADWFGKPGSTPELDHVTGKVSFNGVGEDSHETFAWPPDLSVEQSWVSDEGSVFTFCKTARKPYDPVVVACLLAAEAVLGSNIRVQTDASTLAEYAGDELSDGWAGVNAMLGHPTAANTGETAFQLYERVFGEASAVPRCFAKEQVEAS